MWYKRFWETITAQLIEYDSFRQPMLAYNTVGLFCQFVTSVSLLRTIPESQIQIKVSMMVIVAVLC